MSSRDLPETIAGIAYLIYGIVTLIVVPRFFIVEFNHIINFKLSPADTLAVILRSFGIFMLGLTIIIGVVLTNFWTDGPCLQTLIFLVLTWKTGFVTQYLVYILRIYQCYPNPPFKFAPNQRTLWIIALIIIIMYIIFSIINIIAVSTIGIIEPDTDDLYPFNCSYHLDAENYPNTVLILGCMLFINIFVYFFKINPCTK